MARVTLIKGRAHITLNNSESRSMSRSKVGQPEESVCGIIRQCEVGVSVGCSHSQPAAAQWGVCSDCHPHWQHFYSTALQLLCLLKTIITDSMCGWGCFVTWHSNNWQHQLITTKYKISFITIDTYQNRVPVYRWFIITKTGYQGSCCQRYIAEKEIT